MFRCQNVHLCAWVLFVGDWRFFSSSLQIHDYFSLRLHRVRALFYSMEAFNAFVNRMNQLQKECRSLWIWEISNVHIFIFSCIAILFSSALHSFGFTISLDFLFNSMHWLCPDEDEQNIYGYECISCIAKRPRIVAISNAIVQLLLCTADKMHRF